MVFELFVFKSATRRELVVIKLFVFLFVKILRLLKCLVEGQARGYS